MLAGRGKLFVFILLLSKRLLCALRFIAVFELHPAGVY